MIFEIRIHHVLETDGNRNMVFDITTVGVPLAEASYEDGYPQWL